MDEYECVPLSGLIEIDEARFPWQKLMTILARFRRARTLARRLKMLIVGAIELGDGFIPGRLIG